MFENSLVESTGRIRTRSRRYVAATFMLESAFVAAVILIPYLYPAALPARFLRVPLITPPPPARRSGNDRATRTEAGCSAPDNPDRSADRSISHSHQNSVRSAASALDRL